ncbi:Rossmann-like and DUF2520 domain-containing protein [Pedobacter arcticus]|uniref:Rossmann-like and DUF2520 domain-containing protein n=1 Tax=Pedobacter arcticus TaxID=752140 RepID=UPI0002FD0AD4|nr:DUF2520 domain-containing protein [Pedobacter arcticus]
MRIAMLGAGNVATHLSKALIKSGNPVVQVWSRNNQNAIELALQIGANSIVDFKDINQEVELVIIAVNDDAILSIANQIPKREGQIVVHTSGSTALSVLNTHSSSGVIYPIQTFSKDVDLDFKKIPLCIEGSDDETQKLLFNLAQKLCDSVNIVDSSARLTLHISAVFACNFTNYLFAIAQELLEKSSLSFDLIKPLIFETVNKIAINLPENVQTGPAKRNDEQIMAKHLDILRANPESQEVYRLISQNIVKKHHQPKSTVK